jgi:predicted permease
LQLFYDTFNTIGNSHIICAFLIIGTNLYIQENDNVARFTKRDFIVHLVFKCIILPFFGVIFSTIAQIYIPGNRVLNFASFVQWILPTSIDIITILQAKDINAKDVSICMAIQWVWFTCLSNYVFVPPFLKAVNLI